MASKQSAVRLAETRGMSRESWLEVRQGGIGSSDAAAAVGLCPYKSQLELWLEKTGRAEAANDDPGQDDPRYWGTLLEPMVATAYTERTGRKVRRCNAVLQHPTFPFMLANIDREVVGDDEVQVLECKTAGEFGARLWKDGVPEYVQLQVQHQLAVTGKQTADVAVLLCGQKLEVHRIERDEAIISRLFVLEARFWEYVENDTPPSADGSESAAKALRQLYPGGEGVLDFSEQDVLNAHFDALIAVRGELAAASQKEEIHKQALQQAMGDASRALFACGEVSFKRSKDSLSTDYKRLAAEHPALIARYQTTRPGSRRFLVTPNQPKEETSPC